MNKVKEKKENFYKELDSIGKKQMYIWELKNIQNEEITEWT